jgi:hypothetical protein
MTMLMTALSLGFASTTLKAGDWPQWRGPNRDAKAADFQPPKTWPQALTQKWKVTVGRGDATPALVGDRLYVFARDEAGELVVFEPSDKEFKKLASYKVATTDVYTYPLAVGNRIYVKDQDSVTLWTVE